MSLGVGLKEVVNEARRELNDDLNSLKEFLPEESITKFEEDEERVVRYFENDIENPITDKTSKNGESSVLSSLDFLGLSFEQNEQAETDIKHLRSDDVEPVYRKVQLFKPDNEESFIQTIWWFSQQGKPAILDLLRQVKEKPPYKSDEIMFLLEQAQTEICKRECNNLPSFRKECKTLESFYNLTSNQLKQAIEKMLLNEREDPFAPLPELFAPESIEKAIAQLEETRAMIQKVYKTGELKKWLTTQNRNFLDESPKGVILKGKVFRILQHFIRLGEGIS